MSLREKLEIDLRDSMRDGDTLRRSVMRYLRAQIHNEEITLQTDLDDEGIISVLIRQAQQRRDSVEAYTNGKRQDLVDKENAELAIILEYLPDPMSDEEIVTLVEQVIDDLGAVGPHDMGKVMGKVMPKIRGRSDGRRVSTIAQGLLREENG